VPSVTQHRSKCRVTIVGLMGTTITLWDAVLSASIDRREGCCYAATLRSVLRCLKPVIRTDLMECSINSKLAIAIAMGTWLIMGVLTARDDPRTSVQRR